MYVVLICLSLVVNLFLAFIRCRAIAIEILRLRVVVTKSMVFCGVMHVTVCAPSPAGGIVRDGGLGYCYVEKLQLGNGLFRLFRWWREAYHDVCGDVWWVHRGDEAYWFHDSVICLCLFGLLGVSNGRSVMVNVSVMASWCVFLGGVVALYE
jgi:hypothetical protein